MANLGTLKFEHEGRTLELGISWNDEALMEGKVDFSIDGTLSDAKGKILSVSASIGLKKGPNDVGLLYVRLGEAIVFEEPLEGLLHEGSVLEKIPAHLFGGDPTLGCLVRAGISTGIAQILECKNTTEGIDWYRPRAMAIGRCVRQRIPNMLLKVGCRATYCILKGGF